MKLVERTKKIILMIVTAVFAVLLGVTALVVAPSGGGGQTP